MAKFYPTRRPQNGSITIYYIHKQEKTHFFIGEIVRNENDWIIPKDKDGKATGDDQYMRKKAKRSEEINATITREMNVIKNIVNGLREQELEPTTTLVRDRYNKRLEEKRNATKEMESGITAGKLDVMAMAWEWWNVGKGVKKIWKRSTKRAIKESLEAFEAYIKTIKGDRKLLKSDLSLELIQGYETYLFSDKKEKNKDGNETKKPGLVKNAVGKRLKHIRQFLSTFEGLTFDPKKIKIYQIEKIPIALTETELTKIENIDLSFDEHKDNCRDMFLMGCYTSLRISDLMKLDHQHFHGNEIRILQEKNEKNFRFPITPQIKRILQKYNNQLPKVTDGEINKEIKDVARLAGINQSVELTKELRDKTVRYTKRKYEIIGTHMAVKTFITLGLTWGISIPDIAAIVGKHVRTIQGHYAAGDKEGASERLRDLWEQRTILKVV